MSLRPASCLALLALVVVACADPPAPQPPAPPEVTVAVPEQRDVETYAEFTGRTVAFAQVEVRARVRGFLERVHYQPSEFVREGALLFSIEDADYVAARDQAEAEVLSWESELARLTADVGRLEMALESRAVSVQEVDATRGHSVTRPRHACSPPAPACSKPSSTSAIPRSAHRSRAGSTVGSSTRGTWWVPATTRYLPRSCGWTPIHTYWNMSESMVLELLEGIRKEGRQRRDRAPRQGEYPVFVGLGNEEGWPHEGWIDYMDSSRARERSVQTNYQQREQGVGDDRDHEVGDSADRDQGAYPHQDQGQVRAAVRNQDIAEKSRDERRQRRRERHRHDEPTSQSAIRRRCPSVARSLACRASLPPIPSNSTIGKARSQPASRLTTRPPSRLLICIASSLNGYGPASRGRERNDSTVSSRLLAISETRDLEIPSMPIAFTSLSTLRVDIPSTYASVTAETTARSARRRGSIRKSGKCEPSRTFGIANWMVPARVSQARVR